VFIGPDRNGLPGAIASVLNNPIVVSASASSFAPPTLAIDVALPSRTRVSANAKDV
jgi:hypothetical protein